MPGGTAITCLFTIFAAERDSPLLFTLNAFNVLVSLSCQFFPFEAEFLVIVKGCRLLRIRHSSLPSFC